MRAKVARASAPVGFCLTLSERQNAKRGLASSLPLFLEQKHLTFGSRNGREFQEIERGSQLLQKNALQRCAGKPAEQSNRRRIGDFDEIRGSDAAQLLLKVAGAVQIPECGVKIARERQPRLGMGVDLPKEG